MVRRNFDESEARRWLVAVWQRAGATERRGLLDMAEQLRPTAGDDPRRALDVLASALARRRLGVVRLPVATTGLDAPPVVDIGELVDPLDIPPLPGVVDDPPRDEPPAEPGLTFISFEVVDDLGVRALGDFQVAIDALDDAGPLDEQVHRYDDLREQAEAFLKVENIHWDDTPVVVEPTGPTEPVEPTGPTVAPDEVAFEVVDPDGASLAGQFGLKIGGEVAQAGELSGVQRAEVEGDDIVLKLTDLGRREG